MDSQTAHPTDKWHPLIRIPTSTVPLQLFFKKRWLFYRVFVSPAAKKMLPNSILNPHFAVFTTFSWNPDQEIQISTIKEKRRILATALINKKKNNNLNNLINNSKHSRTILFNQIFFTLKASSSSSLKK